jgi:hypothetical protein
MKKIHYALIISAAIVIIIYFFVVGVTVTDKVEIEGCTAEYKRYVINNLGDRIDPLNSFGRWSNTEENRQEAIIDAGFCLCEKYNKQPSQELGQKILGWCSQLPNCNERLTSNMTYFCEAQLWPFTLGVKL